MIEPLGCPEPPAGYWDGYGDEPLLDARDRPEPPAEDEPQPTPLDRLLGRLVDDEEMERRPPPEYLIDGVLVRDTLAVLFGASGGGKTFVITDWGLSVGSGSWWQGRKVVKGPVLFIAAEGSGGLGARFAAWKAANRFVGPAGMMVLPEPLNLLDPLAVDVLAQVASHIGAVLVLIDTVARSMPGGDENAAKDMGRVVDAADVVRRRTGATVVLVHHAGKDTAAGMRGSSALHAAVATVVECRGGDGRLVLSCAKQKDDAPFDPIHLALVREGESCVVSDRPPEGDELPSGAVDLLRVLDEIADEDGVSSSAWRSSASVAERSFYRWQKQLVDQGLAAKSGSKTQTRYTVAEQGKHLLGGEGRR